MMMTVQIASEPAITNQYDNNMQLSDEVAHQKECLVYKRNSSCLLKEF